MATKNKASYKKEIVFVIEVRYEIKHLDYMGDFTDAIERLRGSGSAEVIDARVEETSA